MREIKVKSGCLARYNDNSPFLIENGILEITVDMPNMNTENFLCYSVGGGMGQIPFKVGEPIAFRDLPPGELTAEIHRYFHGEIIERIKVEPLLLKNTGGDITATPALTELREEIQKLNDKIAELFAKMEEYLGYNI